MRVCALISGGKDSIYAAAKVKESGNEIVCLANLQPSYKTLEMDSQTFQTVGHEIIEAYSLATGLPLYTGFTSGKTVISSLEYKPSESSNFITVSRLHNNSENLFGSTSESDNTKSNFNGPFDKITLNLTDDIKFKKNVIKDEDVSENTTTHRGNINTKDFSGNDFICESSIDNLTKSNNDSSTIDNINTDSHKNQFNTGLNDICINDMNHAANFHLNIIKNSDTDDATLINAKNQNYIDTNLNICRKNNMNLSNYSNNTLNNNKSEETNNLNVLDKIIIPKILNIDGSNDIDEVEDLLNLLKYVKDNIDIDAVCCGAIASTYQFNRFKYVTDMLGLELLCPLLGSNDKKLIKEMIEFGLEAILIKVSSAGLDESFIGHQINYDLVKTFKKLNSIYGMNLCGEGGEFETLTLYCPNFFKYKIKITDYEKIFLSNQTICPIVILRILKYELLPI